MAQSENYREWCAELVGDVGEETFTHCRELFQSLVAAVAQSARVKNNGKQTSQCQQYHTRYDETDIPHRALMLQSQLHNVLLPFLPVALDVQARVLDAVHLLHVQHAVSHGYCLFVGTQCRAAVARLFVVLII